VNGGDNVIYAGTARKNILKLGVKI